MPVSVVDEHVCFQGKQLQFTHESSVNACQMTCSIYLPVEAETQQVPVLWWLSGLTCTDQNFVTKAGAQQFAAQHGLAIVAPDTSPRGDDVPDDPDGAYDFGLGAGFYVDATQDPWSKNYNMYSYITEELPKLVEENFAVDMTKQGIFGHSMGGHGALTIGLKNPDKYTSISAFAPIVSPLNCPWGEKALSGYIGDDRAQWEQYDACALIAKAEHKVPLLADFGDADGFLDEQLKPHLLEEACKNADHPLKLRMLPGYDHSYYFMATFMEDHIRHHADALNG